MVLLITLLGLGCTPEDQGRFNGGGTSVTPIEDSGTTETGDTQVGDEFAVVLWNRNTPKARLAAERLRAAVEMAKVDHKGKRARISATLVGICIDDIDNPTAESLHAKAQKELERIKGSNRTGWAA